MKELVVRLDDDRVELDRIDVGVEEGVIAFEVEGVVRGVDEDVLEALRGRHVRPLEVRFEAVEDGDDPEA